MEFALILPLLLLILFAVIEFSSAMYDKAVITNASREGARRGIVMQPPPRVTPGEITATVTTYCASNLISFGAAPITTTVSAACVNPGDLLTVAVSYPYNFLVLPNFLTRLTGPLVLNGATVMRCE